MSQINLSSASLSVKSESSQFDYSEKIRFGVANLAARGRALTLQEQVSQNQKPVIDRLGKTSGLKQEEKKKKKKVYGHVKACQEKRWTLALKQKSTGERRFVAYRCGSWRCEGDCARSNACQWYARIKSAFDRCGRPELITFLVLTLDPKDWKPEGNESAQDRMFRASNKCWRMLLQKIARKYGPSEFLTVTEQTKRGIPHFNIALVNPLVAADLVGCGKGGAGSNFKNWLEGVLPGVGFGRICFAEPARTSDAIAGYIVKVAGTSALTGEVTKQSQLPVDAPKGFRRIRSSRGFLPPKIKNEDLTGQLIFHPVESVVSEVQAGVKRHVKKHQLAAARYGLTVDLRTGEIETDLFLDEVKKRYTRDEIEQLKPLYEDEAKGRTFHKNQ